jgi:hypothetical protein
MTRRLTLAGGIILLAAGVGVLLIAFTRPQSPVFSGELRILQGSPERLAVRLAAPSPPSAPAGHERPSITGREIPFEQSEVALNWIEPERQYEVFALPFSVMLDKVTVLYEAEPRDVLVVERPDGTERMYIDGDRTIALEGSTFHIAGVRRWSGLLRDGLGVPMAAVALRTPGGEWIEHLFLRSGEWSRFVESVGIHFEWLEAEEMGGAREPGSAHDRRGALALPGTGQADSGPAPARGMARWGVVDGTAIHWFDSFLPGTGVERTDGAVVTLVALNEMPEFGAPSPLPIEAPDSVTGPAICVEFRSGNDVRYEWVQANAESGEVRFEYPAALPQVFVLRARRSGLARITAYQNGEVVGTADLQQGERWLPDGFEYDLRLDQVISQAVPVDLAQSPFDEAVLGSPERILRVRQGEAIRAGDTVLRFEQEAPAPEVRYELRIADDRGASASAVFLGPRSLWKREGWVLSQGGYDARAPETAILHAEYRPGGYLPALGYVLAGCGAALMLIAAGLGLAGRLQRASATAGT